MQTVLFCVTSKKLPNRSSELQYYCHFCYDHVLFCVADKNNITGEDLYEFPVNRTTECARIGSLSYLFNIDSESLCLRFREDSGLFCI